MRKAMTSRGILFAVFSLVLVVIIAFGVNTGCCQTEGLAPVEVREYEGVDLSSINAFRENSIKGPQEIDVESYSLSITGLVTNSTSYTYDEVLNRYQHYKKVVTLRGRMERNHSLGRCAGQRFAGRSGTPGKY
jgi:hypothetical protein